MELTIVLVGERNDKSSRTGRGGGGEEVDEKRSWV